jgi:hypothetical protein
MRVDATSASTRPAPNADLWYSRARASSTHESVIHMNQWFTRPVDLGLLGPPVHAVRRRSAATAASLSIRLSTTAPSNHAPLTDTARNLATAAMCFGRQICINRFRRRLSPADTECLRAMLVALYAKTACGLNGGCLSTNPAAVVCIRRRSSNPQGEFRSAGHSHERTPRLR